VLSGRIAEIGPDRGAVRDIRIELAGASLLARVTFRSLSELGLVPGREVFAIIKSVAIDRHSVGYSLGFEGKTEKIPNSQVTTLSTMCGHGMVSASLAKKMIDWVKEGRRTPGQAVTYMARFCSCGVFNPARAQRVLEDARKKME